MHFLDSFKTMWDHWSYYENKSSLLCTCANPDSYIHLCPCPFSFDSPELPFQLPLSSGSPQMSLACRPLPTAHPMGIYPEHPPPSLLWPALMYYEHCSLSSQIARVMSHSMCPKHSRQTWSLVDAQKKKEVSRAPVRPPLIHTLRSWYAAVLGSYCLAMEDISHHPLQLIESCPKVCTKKTEKKLKHANSSLNEYVLTHPL